MTNFIQLLRRSILNLGRYQTILLVAWLVVMLSLPIAQVIFGEQTLVQGLTLAVLLQLAFVLHVLYQAWGWWNLLRVTVSVVVLTWVAEAITTRSGYPFGSYSFTPLLQPQVMGVPVLVPLVWMMMLPPAWAVSRLITRKTSGCLVRPVFILVCALAFTAWVFYFGPQTMRLGLVEWNSPVGYLGIPWITFLGWLLVSGLTTLAVSPKRLPCGILVLVYGLTWLAGSISQLLFWGLTIPALAGFLLMGGMLLWAAINSR